jgi:hypothetical protein
MKRTRTVIATAIITLLTFGAIIYSSCTKDRCKNVACQNGGTCVNGYCSCPSGYEGDHCEIGVQTTIVYWNHSFTDITLTLNNQAYTIPAGHSKGFQGAYGDTLSGNATTAGAYGKMVIWDSLFNTFPQRGIDTVNLHVPNSYFYLIVDNDSSSSTLKEFQVNWQLGTSEVDFILIPPLPYLTTSGMGYFPASNVSNIHMVSTALHEWYDSLHLPLVQDQYYQAIAN